MYPLITLETYPNMINEDGSDNIYYDEELTEFTVPFSWLVKTFYAFEFNNETQTIEEFLTETYHWDDTLFLYERAKIGGVVVSERIVPRNGDIITNNMELIMGQDHEWWVYDGKRDAYFPTEMSWNKYTEEEMVKEFNKHGFGMGTWIPAEVADNWDI
jgi:hypothetical protein